jgi:hypothetical protein
VKVQYPSVGHHTKPMLVIQPFASRSGGDSTTVSSDGGWVGTDVVGANGTPVGAAETVVLGHVVMVGKIHPFKAGHHTNP